MHWKLLTEVANVTEWSGGVLVERTVGDVLPALIANHEQVIFKEFFVLPNSCNTMLFLDLRFIKIKYKYDQSRQSFLGWVTSPESEGILIIV